MRTYPYMRRGIHTFVWIVVVIAVQCSVQCGVHARAGRRLGSWDEAREGVRIVRSEFDLNLSGRLLLDSVEDISERDTTSDKSVRRGLPTVYRNQERNQDEENQDERQDEDLAPSLSPSEIPSEISSQVPSWSPKLDDAPRPAPGEGQSEAACPSISLSETSLMIRIDRMRGPWNYASVVKTQCKNSDGTEYDPVYTQLGAGRLVVYRNRRYLYVAPGDIVGTLSCGQELECTHALIYQTAFGNVLYDLPGGECGYDYRVFVQWGYRQQGVGFTCEDPGTLIYTLMCSECQSPTFDWDLAYNMSGEVLERQLPSNRTFNYVMVITAVSVVGFVVIVAFIAMVIRGRRRARIDRDVAAMVSRRQQERSGRAQDKPPELFEVGDTDDGEVSMTELAVIGKDYTGPIVVKYDTLVDDPVDDDVQAGPRDLENGSQSLSSDELLLSRNTSKASTNWTLTQIAVLDDEAEEGEEEQENGADNGVERHDEEDPGHVGVEAGRNNDNGPSDSSEPESQLPPP